MNFKRNFLTIISLMGCVFAISACKDKNAFEAFKPIEEVYDIYEDQSFDDGAYVKYGKYADYIAKNRVFENENFGSFYNTFYKKAGKRILESTGDRKLLVIPVDFYGYTCDNLNVKKSEYIENLNKAFFGVAKNNKYVSVAEYYNRSSYGKLRISGKVCDEFYRFSVAFNILNEYTSHTRDDVYNEYPKIIEWYEKTYGESIDEYRINPEDPNSEVAMYLVYTAPYNSDDTGNSDFFWAYTFERRPISWSSYSTLISITGEPDAHTFIHEVGHLFGLVDYYPKNSDKAASNKVIQPSGMIDMMDSSIGDHSAMSKMMLNWARPYHVKNNCSITIKPLITNGDLILINDSWNGTVFDEYYLIEFYSPLGLNAFDVTNGNSEAKLPTLPGIKIHHVDARLAYFVSKGGTTTFSHYCTEQYVDVESGFGNVVGFAHDNSTYPSSTDEQKVLRNYLYELQLNKVGHPVPSCATNENLFHRNDSFEVTNYNGTVNTEKYKITVKSLSFYEAEIDIKKIEAAVE